jgi:hypothetical protein
MGIFAARKSSAAKIPMPLDLALDRSMSYVPEDEIRMAPSVGMVDQ